MIFTNENVFILIETIYFIINNSAQIEKTKRVEESDGYVFHMGFKWKWFDIKNYFLIRFIKFGNHAYFPKSTAFGLYNLEVKNN